MLCGEFDSRRSVEFYVEVQHPIRPCQHVIQESNDCIDGVCVGTLDLHLSQFSESTLKEKILSSQR
jgi:hypothetical protein